MDETRLAEADGLPERIAPAVAGELPPNFVPLCLVLQPSRTPVNICRPDTLVGRHSSCDLRLPLPDVSRRHCRLVFADGNWQVIDLKSLNGVFLNEQPVQNAPLHNGDVLRIGGFSFAISI